MISETNSGSKKNEETKEKGDFATFNYQKADSQNINGLVDRDEALENELRTIVMNYLQKLFCQMALAKKISCDFNQVFAPKVEPSTEPGNQAEELKRQDSPMNLPVTVEQTIHVDNTLLETQAREKNTITAKKLLNSDCLNKQGEAIEDQEEKQEHHFEVINEEEKKIA